MLALDTLRLVRNILLRCFAIGVVFALLMLVATLMAWPVWTGLAISWFHADQAQLSAIVLAIFHRDQILFLVRPARAGARAALDAAQRGRARTATRSRVRREHALAAARRAARGLPGRSVFVR